MTTQQYIGARYVPVFGRKDEESIEWDNSKSYEPLTIVLHEGNSYTSRQFVPAGIDIKNEDFWALTGNYNAQIEQYRQESVALFHAMRIDNVGDATNFRQVSDNVAQANMINVVAKGADNTGETDVTALFNNLLETDDIYIPAGTYHISSPINTTEHSICASPSAHIIATFAMDSMLLIQQSDHARIFVYGGEWDGGGFAQSIINGNCAEMRLARMYAHNYLKDGFNLKNCHAAQVDSIWVEHNQDKGSFAFITNIDSQYSNIRIWHGANGFKTRGLNMFSNIYFWADNQDTSFENIGFDMTQGAHIKGTNIYLDGTCFDFYGGKVNPVDARIDVTNLIIEHNGTDQITTPVMFQVGKYSDINITSNLNVFSAQRMKISPHYFSYHNHLGRINPQTNPTYFFNNILDPEHFFYSLNDDYAAQGIVATKTTPVDTQKGLLICKLISNAYHHVKIRNKIGDLRLDFIMNPTSEYYKVFDYAVPNNYKIKYVKNTDGSVDFYLVNNLENQQTIPGLFVYFVDGVQDVIATCPAPRNETQVDIPETAKEFTNK